MEIYDIEVKTIKGEMVSLSNYKGKVLLIVNTATRCGFTPQYKGLQELYEKYQSQGLEILDFPSNQFANQAPEQDAEIASFCELNYGTKFQTFAKVDVNGPNESPLYTFLKSEKKGFLTDAIKWNFTKFLVDREGKVAGRFSPDTPPQKLEREIEALLAA